MWEKCEGGIGKWEEKLGAREGSRFRFEQVCGYKMKYISADGSTGCRAYFTLSSSKHSI